MDSSVECDRFIFQSIGEVTLLMPSVWEKAKSSNYSPPTKIHSAHAQQSSSCCNTIILVDYKLLEDCISREVHFQLFFRVFCVLSCYHDSSVSMISEHIFI
jgi:hypothetical protein